MAEKKTKFSFKKIFFLKNFFWTLVGKSSPEDKRLNWLSIIFLIAFDIFIVVNIFDGLDNVSQNITNPYTKYNFSCTTSFDSDTSKSYTYNQLQSFKDDRNYNRGKNINAPFYDEDFNSDGRSKWCMELADLKEKIVQDEVYAKNMVVLDNLDKTKYNQESEINSYKKEYDEYRLDVASGLGGYGDRISNINNDRVRSDYQKLQAELSETNQKINTLQAEINALPVIWGLNSYISENKDEFQAEVSHYKFWYPVYVTMMELVLLVPIFLLSVFLYNFSLKRNKKILMILSSNLTFITGLFLFVVLIKVIYWVIPKKFFANLLAYLASIKALAVWNYILTIFGLILFGLFMYISQKSMEKMAIVKAERKKEVEKLNIVRVQKERYWSKTCISCNTKLLDGATHCSNCWTDQYKPCTSCDHRMPKAYTHCEKCGEKN